MIEAAFFARFLPKTGRQHSLQAGNQHKLTNLQAQQYYMSGLKGS